MLTLVPTLIDAYAAAHSAPQSPLLKKLARETFAKMDVPQMQVGRVEGAFLRLLVRLSRARRVLELGTFTGYSALVMAEGLPPGGRLVTCDIDPAATAMARRHWTKSPHGRKIELRLGPALKTLRKLKGGFDLAFIDADKVNYGRYWEAVVPKMRRGGLIVADNVLWSGRVLKPRDASDRALRSFAARVRRDRRVEAAMLTVRDGLMLALKK